MKIKTTSIIIILTGILMVSCRESEELEIVPTETISDIPSRLFLKGSDSLTTNDSISYHTDPPKDPPIKGTDWRSGN